MADKAYEYMDWPRIEAIVYGEEAAPRDVMQPRVTEDGVLIQGFFPGTEAAEVLVGKKVYPMTLEDEAGYYAVMIPLKRIPEYRFRVTRGNMKETFYDAYECPCQITEEEEKAFCAGVYYKAYQKLGAHPGNCGGGALIAMSLGEGKKEKASHIFSFIVAFSAICGIVLGLLGIILIRPVAMMLGA